MTDYYTEKLSGKRLQRSYEIASPRVKQYLEAEIQHVQERLRSTDIVLELGCGYGRVVMQLAEVARRVIGIDTSNESLELARQLAGHMSNCEFLSMNALEMRFNDGKFDTVVCVQNGICAFGVDKESILREALRVTRTGGLTLFSSYSDRFWSHRLGWFEAQADEGLMGSIDYDTTCDGTIVCTDGFRSGRLRPDDFRYLCSNIGVEAEIIEVDDSSVFCEITKPVTFK